MSFDTVKSLPSRAWSCATLADGVAAAAKIAGLSLDDALSQDPAKAGCIVIVWIRDGLRGIAVIEQLYINLQ